MLFPVYVLLLFISAIDIRTHRIPNKVLVVLLVYAVIYLIFENVLRDGVFRAIVVAIFLGILNVLAKSAIGMGDIKLIVVLALFMSTIQLINASIALIALSAAVALISILAGKGLATHIAFAPVIALSFIISTTISSVKK